ncbi:MAG: ribosomal-processing cysteine protease Prp [Hespellia sp.]|nr:ribosomal-processing cysteine protease Prp [Hespellia sp.]
MINVTIYKNERHACMGFTAINHAGYAEAGEDIVCAGASMLMINTMNAIERYTEDETSQVSNEEEALIDYRFKTVPGHDAELLLKAMILGLEELADNEDYEDYITITFEEV